MLYRGKEPVAATLLALTIPRIIGLEKVEQEVATNEKLSKLVAKLCTNPLAIPGYTLVQGKLLYRGHLIILSSNFPMIPHVLHECHDSVVGGHSKFLKIYKKVAANVYWSGMKRDIHGYVTKYDLC